MQQQLSFEEFSQPSIRTVSEVSAEIHSLLSRKFDDIRVSGEISGYKVWQSGHAYFTLKDSGSQLRCVLFRNSLRFMRFKPQDGIAVIARGTVEVRQERGEYQFVVSGLEPQGYGALQLAFQQLKQRLEAEGLFDASRKRLLPRFPHRIGIVTSPRGAVIRDMISVLRRRWPLCSIRLYPTQVQGDGAVEGICEGIERLSKSGWPEVVIVGRGGGSLEDLWAFNEEAVARAIAACSVPVISAVGHETDFTIADFVADLRAPTPSAAAEMVAPSSAELLQLLHRDATRAQRAMFYRISVSARRLHEQGVEKATRILQRRIGRSLQRTDEISYDLQRRLRGTLDQRARRLHELSLRLRDRDVRNRLAQARERVECAQRAAVELMRNKLNRFRAKEGPLAARLDALSPLNVLKRGYALVETAEGALVRRADQAEAGTALRIRLSQGELDATVTGRR